MVKQMESPRIIWIMIKAGQPVDDMIEKFLPLLNEGDVLIDGGNSFYQDSLRRYKEVQARNVRYMDVGVSGGIEGARHGACMMAGGDKEVFDTVEPFLRAMCTENGYGHMGKGGAGHFVKMVHNGIEYGMMSALAEGLQALENNKKDFDFNIGEAIKVYNHGSIIKSNITGWLENAWNEDPYLTKIAGEVPKGETEDEMEKLEGLSDMPVLHEARLTRVKTRENPSLAGRIIAAIRNQFGGHKVKKA